MEKGDERSETRNWAKEKGGRNRRRGEGEGEKEKGRREKRQETRVGRRELHVFQKTVF